MADHAHSTRTPLLPLADHRLPLLGAGLSRHLGPVTLAIRAARHRANPTSALLAAQHQEERRALRELRERIASRIEADLAILDALGGDPDLEADYTTVEHAPGGGLMSLRQRSGRHRRPA
jgi:hypothetical protein